jgi:hypothetical protein
LGVVAEPHTAHLPRIETADQVVAVVLLVATTTWAGLERPDKVLPVGAVSLLAVFIRVAAEAVLAQQVETLLVLRQVLVVTV